jgi:hypothetical protein
MLLYGKKPTIIQCPINNVIMTRKRCIIQTRCFQITTMALYVNKKELPTLEEKLK